MRNGGWNMRAKAICCGLGVVCALTGGVAGFATGQTTYDNLDLSGEHPGLAAAVPVVAVDPAKTGRVAVAWRFIDPKTGADSGIAGNWVCHLSVSGDDGKTFQDQPIDWGLAGMTRCNAPWVGLLGPANEYLAATLTGSPPPATPRTAGSAALPPRQHPNGTAGFKVSHDDGHTWDPTLSVIPSNALPRFETDASIPNASKLVPWDGARGAIDASTHRIYLSGAFPAPPGQDEQSQRFYSVSEDGGATFGVIRAFGNAAWPERWDGDIAAANGDFAASYIGASTPDANRRCPCAILAVSHDAGKTLTRRLIAGAEEFDLDTLVHYPEVAADPARRHRFALVLISSTKSTVLAYVTANDGKTVKTMPIPQPPGVVSVTRPAVAFSSKGVMVVAWRGVHADGSYDIYLAASTDGKRINDAVKVSAVSSQTPDAWRKTYAVRGDFHTSVAADESIAHVAWADARSGRDVRIVYARVPLRDMLKSRLNPEH